MRAMIAAMILACGAVSCGSTQKLPDLPPPEYETPRGYEMGGASKPAPTASPSAAPTVAPTAPTPAKP